MRNSLLCQKLLFPYALTHFPLRAPPCPAGVARIPLLSAGVGGSGVLFPGALPLASAGVGGFLTSENDGILRALVRRSTKSTVFWSFRFSPPDMVTFCKFEVHTHKNNYPRNKNMEHFNAFEIPWLLTRKASKRRTKLGMERNGEGPWLWQELGCWVEQWQFYGTLIQQKEKDNAF